MAAIWHPQPIEVYKSWVDTILDEASDNLTNWEEIFLDDLNIRLGHGNNLTEKQAEILERIYAEKTK
jgi:hypothetical protein